MGENQQPETVGSQKEMQQIGADSKVLHPKLVRGNVSQQPRFAL